MTAARKSHHPWLSWLAFAAMVGAAGLITWYGLGQQDQHPVTSVAEPLTIAATTDRVEPAFATGFDTGSRTGLPTRVIVPTLGIDAPVQGVGIVDDNGQPVWQTAWTAVGHHIDSAFPGQPGNVVLTGHVSVVDDRAQAYFAALEHAEVGDIVELYSGATVYRYRIDEVAQVDPDALRVLRSDHRSRVTLITCTRDLQHRLVVVGTLLA